MDVARPPRTTRGRYLAAAVATFVIVVVLARWARSSPAALAVERSAVWIDEVRMSDLTREVHGVGSLVPQRVRWIPAVTSGRIEQIVVKPGSLVNADTVIIEMSDPQTVQGARDSEWELRAAEADLDSARAEAASVRLDDESSAVRLEAERDQLRLKAEADEKLASQGVIAPLTAKLSKNAAGDASRRYELERLRLAARRLASQTKLNAQHSRVEQTRALETLQQQRLKMLHVRAGMHGMLQQITVEVGQSVSPGTPLARVAGEDRLDGQLKIAEGDASEVRVGQRSLIDTHQAILRGHVSRIDPAAREGTVTVDVLIDDSLPAGLRPDLTVDGAIELSKRKSILTVSRPAQAREGSAVELFRLVPGSSRARRVRVTFGVASTKTIEVKSGLKAGDRVIISDTSAWDGVAELRIEN